MACIILELNGSKRSIPEGQPYRLIPGEKITGVDENCNGKIQAIGASKPSLHDELAREIGGGFGDWIRTLATPIATVLGKKGCTSCEARRLVTNAYARLKAKHGQMEALAIIKDLWALSFRSSGDDVLRKLKEVLHD